VGVDSGEMPETDDEGTLFFFYRMNSMNIY